MADHRERTMFDIHVDSDGDYIIAAASHGLEPIDWPGYNVSPRGAVLGPATVTNFVRFNPSDYRKADGPFPDPVHALMERMKRGDFPHVDRDAPNMIGQRLLDWHTAHFGR